MSKKIVWLPRSAFDGMLAEATSFYDLETGGSLMGYWADDNAAVVTKIIPAGPNAEHNRYSFKPDQSWQLEAIAEHYESSGRRDTYLGDWHTHPNAASAVLSWTDRACLKSIIRTPAARTKTPIMILVCGKPDGWQIHPKICRLGKRMHFLSTVIAQDASVKIYA